MYIAALIFLLSAAVRILYLYFIGVHIGGDTLFYDTNAHLVMASGYNPFSLLQAGIPPYYWLYPYILGLLQDNHLAIIIVQILLQGIASVLLYKIGTILFNRQTGIIAGISFGLFFEVFQWDTYILTDSLFIFLLVVSAYFLVKKLPAAFATSILAVVLLRPTSLPLLAAVGMYGISTLRLKKKYIVVFLLVLGTSGLLLAYALDLFDPNRQYGIAYYLRYFFSLFERGIVIRDRPDYILPAAWDTGFSAHNLFLFLNIFLHKLAAFWYVTVQDFSWAHKLLNIFTLVPLYCFGVLGYIYNRKEQTHINIYLFFLHVILFFWVFHALTEVDFDFRYRLPVLPFVLLFASYGFSQLLRDIKISRAQLLELVRYVIVGLLVTASDIAVLNILIHFFHVNIYLATLLGFITGTAIGYSLHRTWTFRYAGTNNHALKISQLLVVSLVGLTLTECIMYAGTQLLHTNYNIAKLAALIASFLWAYSCTKWWVFRKDQ